MATVGHSVARRPAVRAGLALWLVSLFAGAGWLLYPRLLAPWMIHQVVQRALSAPVATLTGDYFDEVTLSEEETRAVKRLVGKLDNPRDRLCGTQIGISELLYLRLGEERFIVQEDMLGRILALDDNNTQVYVSDPLLKEIWEIMVPGLTNRLMHGGPRSGAENPLPAIRAALSRSNLQPEIHGVRPADHPVKTLADILWIVSYEARQEMKGLLLALTTSALVAWGFYSYVRLSSPGRDEELPGRGSLVIAARVARALGNPTIQWWVVLLPLLLWCLEVLKYTLLWIET